MSVRSCLAEFDLASDREYRHGTANLESNGNDAPGPRWAGEPMWFWFDVKLTKTSISSGDCWARCSMILNCMRLRMTRGSNAC